MMNHKKKNINTGRQIKKEGILTASLAACLFGFVFRIPLTYMIGDKGVGYLAVGMELFLVVSIMTSYALTKAVASLVRFRMKRELYKSVSKVLRTGIMVAIVSSILLAGLLLIFARPFAKEVMQIPLSYLAIAAAVPGMVFVSVVGVLRGYFQGMGSSMPSIHSKYIEKVIFVVSGLLGAFLLYRYGIKIGAFLKSDDYTFAYGAMGGALGLSISALTCLLHLLLIFSVYKASGKGKLQREGGKTTEKSLQIIITLIKTALPYSIGAIFFNLNYLVGQAIFNRGMIQQGKSEIMVRDFGIYYGKYGAVIGVASLLITLAISRWIPAVAQSNERQMRGEAKEQLGRCIHQLAVTAIPVGVLFAVLAEPMMGLIFGEGQKRAAQMIQMGSVLVVLFPLTYVLAAILKRIRKLQTVIVAGLIAFFVYAILLTVLMFGTKLGIASVIVSNLVFYLVAAGVCFFVLSRHLSYGQEWLRSFGITIVAAGVSGVAGLLLNKLLFAAAGNLITLIVCLPVCISIYCILLLILRGVDKAQLTDMPLGGVLVSIGRKLHIF